MTIEVNHINSFKWHIKQWFSTLATQSNHLWDLEKDSDAEPLSQTYRIRIFG